jgi:phosphohistidine phosphatase SixA
VLRAAERELATQGRSKEPVSGSLSAAQGLSYKKVLLVAAALRNQTIAIVRTSSPSISMILTATVVSCSSAMSS